MSKLKILGKKEKLSVKISNEKIFSFIIRIELPLKKLKYHVDKEQQSLKFFIKKVKLLRYTLKLKMYL